MDFERMLKSIGDPREIAKYELGEQANAYFERLYKITGIARNMYEIDANGAREFLVKFTPVIEQLTADVNKLFEDFQKEHGEA